MEAGGATPVSPTQAQLFAVLDDEGTTVSELARRMGVTRQTAHQAVHGLIAAGLLEQVPDPASARQRLIRRTPDGERAHRQAGVILERLEEQLAERIGRGRSMPCGRRWRRSGASHPPPDQIEAAAARPSAVNGALRSPSDNGPVAPTGGVADH